VQDTDEAHDKEQTTSLSAHTLKITPFSTHLSLILFVPKTPN